MHSNPIVEEVRRIRDAYARSFNHELDEICRDLQKKQKRGTRKVASLPSKRPEKSERKWLEYPRGCETMPRAKRKRTTRTVESLRHQDATRKNIPTAEYQAVMKDDDRNPIEVAYERRNRDLDPQLVWRGKDEKNWSDLVVQAPPLFIQEKVQPKVLIDDLRQRSRESEAEKTGRANRAPNPTCSPISTGCRMRTLRRNSMSMTRTGRTG